MSIHTTKREGEGYNEMIDQFMGYTVHRPTRFHPSATLFSKGNEAITVSMLQEALVQMISAITKKNPILERYSVALKVLRAIQIRLTNGQPRKPSKKDFEVACDVLSEIQKENAMTQAQRDSIDAAASLCKLYIKCFGQD